MGGGRGRIEGGRSLARPTPRGDSMKVGRREGGGGEIEGGGVDRGRMGGGGEAETE